MQQEQITKIFSQIADHETRLKLLEGGTNMVPVSIPSSRGKQKTLRELVKGKKFKSGQEQIAIVVGYHEKVLGKRISKSQIKEEWKNAKMNGKFSAMVFSRAKDTLIRIHSDDTCDLTQTGDEFFNLLLNNEYTPATSK